MNQYLKTIQSQLEQRFDHNKQSNKHNYDHHCAKDFEDVSYTS